jgi:hypothetical protein
MPNCLARPGRNEFKYCVITVNKAGDAEPSNTVVVL